MAFFSSSNNHRLRSSKFTNLLNCHVFKYNISDNYKGHNLYSLINSFFFKTSKCFCFKSPRCSSNNDHVKVETYSYINITNYLNVKSLGIMSVFHPSTSKSDNSAVYNLTKNISLPSLKKL